MSPGGRIPGSVKTAPGVSASEIADQEQISRPTMSAHVKRLEDAGWVLRQVPGEDADRRRQGLEITGSGLRVLQDIRRQRTDWLAARLTGLSVAERSAIEAALQPLTAMLEVKR